jgi:hypothetical protein
MMTMEEEGDGASPVTVVLSEMATSSRIGPKIIGSCFQVLSRSKYLSTVAPIFIKEEAPIVKSFFVVLTPIIVVVREEGEEVH